MKQPVKLATPHRTAAILSRVGFLAGLDPGVIFALSDQLRQVEVLRGEMVYSQDEPADGLHIILGDDHVKSVLVNVFGGITSCDEVANGIVGALKVLGDEATKPLVVRLDGNKVEEGRRILAEAAHPLVTVEETMDGAARKAAELASAANKN